MPPSCGSSTLRGWKDIWLVGIKYLSGCLHYNMVSLSDANHVRQWSASNLLRGYSPFMPALVWSSAIGQGLPVLDHHHV